MSEDPVKFNIKADIAGKSEIKADISSPKEVNFNYDKTEVVFSDLVRINVSPETVSLDFAQRSRINPAEVNVTHSVVLTIPHFLRLVETSRNLAKPIVDDIEKFRKEQTEK